MDFKLKDARPIWQQLADQMTESIVTGEYPPGERFPSVRELALQAVTSRTAGRNVTEDEETLRTVKKQLAEKRVAEYLEDMEKLGFSSGMAADYTRQFQKGQKP